jgi:hypothetical protein
LALLADATRSWKEGSLNEATDDSFKDEVTDAEPLNGFPAGTFPHNSGGLSRQGWWSR